MAAQSAQSTQSIAPLLLTRREAQIRAGVSRSFIFAGVKTGAFPKAIRLGPKVYRWHIDDIDQWAAEHKLKKEPPKKKKT